MMQLPGMRSEILPPTWVRRVSRQPCILALLLCVAARAVYENIHFNSETFVGAKPVTSRRAAAVQQMLRSPHQSNLVMLAGSNAASTGVLLPPMEKGEPAWMAFVILRYLDEEWVEQPVHQLIGDAVGRIYEESRAAGDNDLITVVAKLAHGLKEMWGPAGFSEAFEGPIEIANRVAELLMLRQGHTVLSFGPSHSATQAKMVYRLREYEGVRRSIIEAVGSAHPL